MAMQLWYVAAILFLTQSIVQDEEYCCHPPEWDTEKMIMGNTYGAVARVNRR